MTIPELHQLFKTELAHLVEKGLEVPFVRPIVTSEGEHIEGVDYDHPKPHTHELWTHRPFIFDIRKIPDTFHGFKLYVFYTWEDRPKEFCGPEPEDDEKEERDEEHKLGIVIYPIDILLPPERVIAYAEEHAIEICEQLNDYTFTLKNMCDMIVGRDFEQHKEECEKIRLRRLLG